MELIFNFFDQFVTIMKINLSWEDYPCEPDQLINKSKLNPYLSTYRVGTYGT